MANSPVAAVYERMLQEARKHLTMKVLMVTPEMTKLWLNAQPENRPLGEYTVARYARYMVEGKWFLNGEPIILDRDGLLLDGQHRLWALERATITVPTITVPMLVISGVPREAFTTLDQGKYRSGSDTFALLGEKHHKTLAAALSWLGKYETNRLEGKAVNLSNQDLVALLRDFPGIRQSVAYVTAHARKGYHPLGPFSFLHYVCTSRYPKDADFFAKVFSGAEVEHGSPVHLLNQLIADRVRANEKSPLSLIGSVIKAWNANLLGLRPRKPRDLMLAPGERIPGLE